MKRSRTDYGSWAAVYDGLAQLYSWGAIARTKRWHLSRLPPGAHVLYAGAGTAQEALAASCRGAVVTLLDSSPHMLQRARRAFDKAGQAATFVCRTLEEHVQLEPSVQYDAVTAHFFLNVFAPHELDTSIGHLSRLLAPEGRLYLADFAAPSPSWGLRLLQRLYYWPPLALFALFASNPWHELYDYAPRLLRQGLRRTALAPARVLGLPLYEASCFERGPSP